MVTMDRRRHAPPRVVGRYAVFDLIATGGMASVHFGRLLGAAGFSRTVVIKRLHAQHAGDPEFATMFLDEARVAARIRHPNVVTVIDVAQEEGETLLVMEYVHGESLAYLSRAEGRREPGRLQILGNVMAGALAGLHAAHEATGEDGLPLGVVHRDFSPQNILVGVDGTARVADFGVAKAAGQSHCTGAGQLKGKIRYLSPEQVLCADVDRRSDLWAASVVLWEALTGKKLFSGEHDAGVLLQVLDKHIPSPRDLAPEVPEALARVVMRGLSRDRSARFATALEMATALEAAVGLLPPRAVGAWVERLARGRLEERRRVLDDIEVEVLASFTPAHAPVHTQTFAVTTDVAMVRPSWMEGERPTVAEPAVARAPRAPMIAWAAAAGVVMVIAGGVGARLLGVAPPLPPVVTTAALAPPVLSDGAAETRMVELPEEYAAPEPPPAPSASARVDPLRDPRRLRPLPGRSRLLVRGRE
jgi:hypothetical protein